MQQKQKKKPRYRSITPYGNTKNCMTRALRSTFSLLVAWPKHPLCCLLTCSYATISPELMKNREILFT